MLNKKKMDGVLNEEKLKIKNANISAEKKMCGGGALTLGNFFSTNLVTRPFSAISVRQ